MDSTYHYPVKLIFQAHLRMYSLTHTDSLAQPRKLLCFKVFAMYSQCKVFLLLNYIIGIWLTGISVAGYFRVKLRVPRKYHTAISLQQPASPPATSKSCGYFPTFNRKVAG
jgi:hypothetical protein